MFIKLYRYKIKKDSLPEWKRIMKGSEKIYKKHGDKSKFTELMRKDKNFISIIQINYYSSEVEFNKIEKSVAVDLAFKPFFEDFNKILFTKKVTEENFEPITY